MRIVFISIMIVLVVACDSPRLHPLEQNDIILAFGDSLTKGVGTSENFSYPNVLSSLTGLTVINAGISGETTEEGLARLPAEIEKYHPSLLILLEGGNDILRNKDRDGIKQNLDKMISLANSREIQIVLIGVPEKKLFSDSAPLYRELAEKHDLVFDGALIGRLMRSPSKKSDSIHFNKAGYQEMAESIHALLQKNGAF